MDPLKDVLSSLPRASPWQLCTPRGVQNGLEAGLDPWFCQREEKVVRECQGSNFWVQFAHQCNLISFFVTENPPVFFGPMFFPQGGSPTSKI